MISWVMESMTCCLRCFIWEYLSDVRNACRFSDFDAKGSGHLPDLFCRSSYFSTFGEVEEAFVSYDRVTGRPRGFGFVVYKDPDVAQKVIGANHTVDGRKVRARVRAAAEICLKI